MNRQTWLKLRELNYLCWMTAGSVKEMTADLQWETGYAMNRNFRVELQQLRMRFIKKVCSLDFGLNRRQSARIVSCYVIIRTGRFTFQGINQ